MPVVRSEPLSNEDREWIASVTARLPLYRTASRVLAGLTMLQAFVALPVALFVLRVGVVQISISIVVGIGLLFVASAHVDALEALRKADEKWLFERRRAMAPPRNGLVDWYRRLRWPRTKVPVCLAMPGKVPIGGSRYPLTVATWTVADRVRETDGCLGSAELKEIRRRADDYKSSADSYFLLLLGYGIGIQIPEEGPWVVAWIAVLSLVLGGQGLRMIKSSFAEKRLRSIDASTKVITLSILSPAFGAIKFADPDLDSALRQIEVVESGLLWTVDDRPAAWRIYGTAPVFLKKSALELPAVAPSALRARDDELSLP